MNNVLLVIDIQKEFRDNNGEYEKVLQYIKDKGGNYDCILGTIFENIEGSMYTKHLSVYFLNWYKGKHEKPLDMEDYNVRRGPQLLDCKCDDLIIRHGYSANEGNKLEQCIDDIYYLIDKNMDVDMPKLHFDIIGCDAETCILATAFFLWNRGEDFSILSDYIYTTADDFSKEDSLKIMRRNFGDCVK